MIDPHYLESLPLLHRAVVPDAYLDVMGHMNIHNLAATLETVTSHVDLTIRRTSPFPEHVAANITDMLTKHRKLAWEPPVCGVMNA